MLDFKEAFGIDREEYEKENAVLQRLFRMELKGGSAADALQTCNEELAAHPDNRLVRLHRAMLNEGRGQTIEAAADLDYLLEKYPDFKLTYAEKAKSFLKLPVQPDGSHPLDDWLRSNDPKKVQGAINVVNQLIREHQGRLKTSSKDGGDSSGTKAKTEKEGKEGTEKEGTDHPKGGD